MKIHREIKSNERLPTKEGYYWTIRKVGKIKSVAYFIPNYNPELWIAANEYWLEPLEVELDSEKILPKEERMGVCSISDNFTYVKKEDYNKAIKALEAAELQIIHLKESKSYLRKRISSQCNVFRKAYNPNESIEFGQFILDRDKNHFSVQELYKQFKNE